MRKPLDMLGRAAIVLGLLTFFASWSAAETAAPIDPVASAVPIPSPVPTPSPDPLAPACESQPPAVSLDAERIAPDWQIARLTVTLPPAQLSPCYPEGTISVTLSRPASPGARPVVETIPVPAAGYGGGLVSFVLGTTDLYDLVVASSASGVGAVEHLRVTEHPGYRNGLDECMSHSEETRERWPEVSATAGVESLTVAVGSYALPSCVDSSRILLLGEGPWDYQKHGPSYSTALGEGIDAGASYAGGEYTFALQPRDYDVVATVRARVGDTEDVVAVSIWQKPGGGSWTVLPKVEAAPITPVEDEADSEASLAATGWDPRVAAMIGVACIVLGLVQQRRHARRRIL